MLQELDHIPAGLLDLPATRLGAALAGPTLIHLQGRRDPPLLVSVLMHGNEPTGWDAARTWLRRYRAGGGGDELPRSVSLFVGNVAAAAQVMRHLPDQPDYNRVWPGCETGGTREHALMHQVVEIMRRRGVFASVDVHNNTGMNPHYACVNVVDNRFLHLATLFSRTVVYFIRPCGVQSLAMSKLCPAVTLECGKAGQEHGTEHAREYLEACLHLSRHPEHPVAPQDIDLFHTVATVKVPPSVAFSFDGSRADVRFITDLEFLNFRELPAGTAFAEVAGGDVPLDVRDDQGRDVAPRFFEVADGMLRTRCAVMPSMLTRDTTVVRQDCLCYLMERYDSHLPPAGGRKDAHA
jgi:hypothetical protein